MENISIVNQKWFDGKRISVYILAVLFSVLTGASESIRVYGDLDIFQCANLRAAKSIGFFVICLILYFLSLQLLFAWFEGRICSTKGKTAQSMKWLNLVQIHPFLCTAVVLLIFWIPQVIVAYPGAMCCDNYYDLFQAFGQEAWGFRHPPMYSLLIGGCVKLGKLFGSDNAGLFLLVVIQLVLFITVLALSVCLLKSFGICKYILVATILLYAISPLFIGYITIPMKDSLYSISFLGFMLGMILMLKREEEFIKHKCGIVGFIFVTGFLMLMRNNGVYVVLPTMLLVAIYWLVTLRRKCISIWRVAVLLLPFFIFFGANQIFTTYLHAKPYSSVEMMTIPLQQTARYVKEHADEVTQEERSVIDKIVEYDKLASSYKPTISDPIKSMYHSGASMSDKKEYARIWMAQLIKHPRTYAEATLSVTYPLFDWNEPNAFYYDGVDNAYSVNSKHTDFTDVKELQGIHAAIQNGYRILHKIPVVSLLWNGGFACMLLLAMAFHSILKRRVSDMILFAPMILSLLVCVAAPVIYQSVRYVLPIIYPMPVVLLLYAKKGRKSSPHRGGSGFASQN